MLDILVGATGVVIFIAAVATAFLLDALGQTVWDGPVAGRARVARWVVRGVLVVLVVAAVAVTGLRFYSFTS